MCRQQNKTEDWWVSEPPFSSSDLAELLAGKSKAGQKQGRKGSECHTEQLDFSLGIGGEPEEDFEQEWGVAVRLGKGQTGDLVCLSCGKG